MSEKDNLTDQQLDERAYSLARFAWEKHHPVRGGLWWIKDLRLFCYFCNRVVGIAGDYAEVVDANDLPVIGLADYRETVGGKYPNSIAILIDVGRDARGRLEEVIRGLNLPLGTGLGLPCRADADAHVIVGGAPYLCCDMGETQPGYGMVILAEDVGNPFDVTGDFYEEQPMPHRYVPAGSMLLVRWLYEPHPSTGLRQAEALDDPLEALPTAPSLTG